MAECLYKHLSNQNFSVFYDKEKILIGEAYGKKITDQIEQCEGFIALLSKESAVSAWCQAELYQAHHLQKIIIPVRAVKEEISLSEPLQFLQQPYHYVFVPDKLNPGNLETQVGHRVKAVRDYVYFKWIKQAVALVVFIGLLVLGLAWVSRNINAVKERRERQATLQRIETSSHVINQDAVGQIQLKHANDDELLRDLQIISQNIEKDDVTRLNAMLISSALLEATSKERRWYIEQLDWQNTQMNFGDLSHISLVGGSYDQLTFNRTTFSGVSWNTAPTGAEAGLMVSK